MAKTTAQPTTELGRQLEKERENRDLSIEEWCEELKVSRQQYLQWRTRPVELQLINARRIATVLGVTITVVFGWVDVDVPIIHGPSTHPNWFRRPMEIHAAETTLSRLACLSAGDKGDHDGVVIVPSRRLQTDAPPPHRGVTRSRINGATNPVCVQPWPGAGGALRQNGVGPAAPGTGRPVDSDRVGCGDRGHVGVLPGVCGVDIHRPRDRGRLTW